MPFPFNSRYQYKRTNVFVQTKEQNSSHRLDQGDFSTAAATISIWVFGEIEIEIEIEIGIEIEIEIGS